MLTFDMRAFEEAARSMKAARDQMPFAISVALNKAAQVTEARLASETWARHVEVRNRGFIRAALEIERSDKRNLRVAVYDRLGRANLKLHDTGGTARSKGGRFAIPTSKVRKGSKGVIASQRPANLKRKVVKGGLIFQAVGTGKASRLQLMFNLRPTNQVKADVPFRRDFQRFMREEMRREFPKAMLKAMRTRR